MIPPASLSRLLALVLGLAGAFGAAPAPAPRLLTWPDLLKRPRPAPDATLSYGADRYQRVDLWRPAGKGPFPVVLMVHGGCWTTSVADRTLMNWVADDLRRHGIAVWNIDYRGVDRPGGGYPGTFADAAAAADLLAGEGPKRGLDVTRVVAVGHSAGGHLALWLAARGRLPRSSAVWRAHPLAIRHAISLGGLPDLEATAASADNGCGTEVVGQLVGHDRPDPYADTSVPRLLPIGVPQDLVNGREDKIIPYRMAGDYVAKAQGAGDVAMLHTVPATGHVELVTPDSAAWAEARHLITEALVR